MEVLSGERAWFCQQIESNKAGMYRLGKSILKNEEDVNDAMQEAILTAYTKLDTLRDRSKFRPWIMRILTNASYNILRRKKGETDLEALEEIPAAQGADIDDALTLQAAISHLSDDLRAVTVLFYYEDMSVRQIGTILQISPGAVKTRLCRARQRLKMILTDEGGEYNE